MIALLRDNPLLLLFVIAAIGWPLGRVAIGGVRLGVAAVLFTGLAVGALSPDLKLPEIIYLLGLVIFVYTVGLNSGSNFFLSIRHKGLRDNFLVVAILLLAAGLALIASQVLGLRPTEAVGLFAGSLTNTPALAGAIEFLKVNSSPSLIDSVIAEPVVAFSITYPMGVLGMILAIYAVQRVWKIDYKSEAQRGDSKRVASVPLDNRTIRITQAQASETPLSEIEKSEGWQVVFGRIKRKDQLSLVDNHLPLQLDDLVTVVGAPQELDRVTLYLGEVSQDSLDLDRHELDYRRVFVSNANVAGHTLRELNLPQHFGAVITRVRRGDIQLVPTGDTELQLGDRVRVLTRRDHLQAVSNFLGDSYRGVSEMDVLTFSLGLAFGVLVGLIPIPLLAGLTLTLGMAGGPLLVALVLGAVGRTGPFLWSLPYGTNLTLRQFGLILFLAGVGSRSGYAFVTTLAQGNGLALFATGILITLFAALSMLWIGYRLLKIPMGLLTGMLAGLQTQPALLGFASEQSGDDLPNVGYASVYPVATITKIVLAQVILALLLR